MARTACTELQCLYKGALYLILITVLGCAHYNHPTFSESCITESHERNLSCSAQCLSEIRLDAYIWSLFLKLLPVFIYNVNVRKLPIKFHSGNRN